MTPAAHFAHFNRLAMDGPIPQQEMESEDSTAPMERDDVPPSERKTLEMPAVQGVLESLQNDCNTGHSELKSGSGWGEMPRVGYVQGFDGDPDLILKNCPKCGSTVCAEVKK